MNDKIIGPTEAQARSGNVDEGLTCVSAPRCSGPPSMRLK